MDLYKWEIDPTDRGEMLPVIEELADRLEPEHGITLHRMRRRDFAQEVKAFMEVYNLAWSRNWGFVPLTDPELDSMAKELKPVLDEDFACVAKTADGEIAGVSLSLPDYNQVLAKLNGRLLPLGWIKALRGRSKIDEVRVFALGVKPQFQHTGVAAGLYRDIWDACLRRKIQARRDRLDPRGQRADEPRDGGAHRPHRQALPPVRATARPGRGACFSSPALIRSNRRRYGGSNGSR